MVMEFFLKKNNNKEMNIKKYYIIYKYISICIKKRKNVERQAEAAHPLPSSGTTVDFTKLFRNLRCGSRFDSVWLKIEEEKEINNNNNNR